MERPVEVTLSWALLTGAWPADADLVLDDTERARRDTFSDDRAARRFVLGRTLLRRQAGRLMGVPPGRVRFDLRCAACGRHSHGKPVPVGADDVHLSVSHSGDIVVAAGTRGARVGVDVETFAKGPARSAALRDVHDVLLSPTERTLPPWQDGTFTDESVLRTWTRKEAVLKALGVGLASDPAGLVVSGPSDAPKVLQWAGPEAVDEMVLMDLDQGPGVLSALSVITRSPVVVREAAQES